MSFHEKSAWACLVSIVLVFVPYLAIVLQQPLAFGLLAVAVIILAVILTAFHIVNAIVTRSIRETGDTPPHDELDRMIELRASKRAGVVLAVAVMGWCLGAMVLAPALASDALGSGATADIAPALSQLRVPVSQALIAIHLLFAGFIIANTVYYGSIVASYRRLAHG